MFIIGLNSTQAYKPLDFFFERKRTSDINVQSTHGCEPSVSWKVGNIDCWFNTLGTRSSTLGFFKSSKCVI